METQQTASEPAVDSTFARVFGLERPSENAVRLIKILVVLLPSFAMSFQISTTFWMIYIAETLGGEGGYVAGITLVGFLVVIQLGIQTALDYPTGAIGDWIGQRYVIASALLCYGASFYITSIVTPESPFYMFVAIYALMGLGASQESGAFNAWFDNNYRVAMPHDKDRKMYGVFWGRMGMIWQVASTAVLIPGSWLAMVFARQSVFLLQAVASVLLALIVLRLIKDLPGVRDEAEKRPSLRQYGSLLKDGFKFLWSSRFISYLIMGQILLWSTGPVWWNILLFPLYYGYLITDVAVSAYRTLIFIPQALINERSGVWAKRFDAKKWIPRLMLMQFGSVIFYFLLALIIQVLPPPDPESAVVSIVIPLINLPILELPVQSVLPVALLFLTFVVLSVFGGIAGILLQRVMLDVIPNRIRNSMYSLQPTLSMLVSMPLIAFFGWFLPLYDFPLTFFLCGIICIFGVYLIKKAFDQPIPKAEDLVPATEEEREAVEELEIT
jgi:MFS family permease